MRTSAIVLACALALAAAATIPARGPSPAPVSSETAWRASDASQLRRARLFRNDDAPHKQISETRGSARTMTGLWLLLLSGLGAAFWIAGRGVRLGFPAETFAKIGATLRPVSAG